MIRRLGTRLVRAASGLYPRPFPQELAADLVSVFERELDALLRDRRRGAALWLCTRTAMAIVREAFQEGLIARRVTGAGGGGGGAGRTQTPLATLTSDFKLAIRTQTSEPWTTTAIVVTLALGIGATTTVYALFNYAVFRPVPGIADQQDLVSVFVAPDHASRSRNTMSDDHLRAVREMPAFSGLAAHYSNTYPFRSDATAAPESRRITRVTVGYFDLLEVEPVAGRLFRPEEYAQPGGGVAVISEHLWRSRYESDSAVVGSDVFILDHRFTLVGVARDFRGLDNIGDEDVWVPVTAAQVLTPDRGLAHQLMVGRLAPGMTLEAARQQAADAVAAVGPIRVRDDAYTAVVFPGLTDGIGVTLERLMRVYWTAMAGVSILFLLACVNAANLLVARNVRRRRNLALKVALGASRLRVLREMAMEAAVVALLAAVAGLGAGMAMAALFRSERLLEYLPTLDGLTVDWRVGVYATLAACVSVFLAAALPSAVATRWHPQRGLRDFGPGNGRGNGRLRDAFVVLQIALSVALVACTGVFARTLHNLEHKDMGFDADGLYEVSLVPRTIGYDLERANRFYREVEAGLADTPGIASAAFGWWEHLGPTIGTKLVTPEGETVLEPAQLRTISASYFRTMGIALLAGRGFTEQETAGDASSIVVVDEALATEIFGQQGAIGRQIFRGSVSGGPEPLEIVGVVANSGGRELREQHIPTLYQPAGTLSRATFKIRSRLPQGETAALVQRVIRNIEPALPVDGVMSLRDHVAQITAQERLLAKLGSILAALALAIAVAGIYSAVACRVAEQTRELGIRMALGATQRTVGLGVLRRVLVLAALGTAAGLALYGWGSRFIEAWLYGVSSLDAATLVGAAALILVAALAAAWLPARRATRVDPTIAMRAS